jgi:hypothetical protein
MDLREVLLHKTKVGDLVLIKDCGWQVGCTIIDYEDFFINSFNGKFLMREVKDYYYEPQDWTTKNVMIVNLKY